jgi:hypothetical protein
MRNTASILLLCLLCLAFFSLSVAQEKQEKVEAKHKYVGVKVCAPCHKTEKQGMQIAIWEKSKHAMAFKTLESEEAKKIAKDKGIEKAPTEAPECVGCHTLGPDVKPDTALFDAKFDIKDGVQCETCHGAGSDYKALSVMKDRKKSIEAGLMIAENKEEFCKTCHNDKSPTFKEFNIEEMWKQIAHPVPKAK